MDRYEPLVSIIIPVYNGTNYMCEAIDSALAQTYENLEIIVVNDGSTDDGETDKMARSYGDKIKYYEKENGGCASALNYGISKMRGEWFSWLSHDDKYYPEKIKKSIDFINENQLQDGDSLVYCNSDLMDEKGNTIFHPLPFVTGQIDAMKMLEGLLFEFSVNGCALLIHKKVLDTVGSFDESLKYTPDFDYWLRAALAGYGMASFNEKLCSNRVHAGQVSVKCKDRMKPDIIKQLIKINGMLKDRQDCEKMTEKMWLYAYSRGFFEEADALWETLKTKSNDLKGIIKTGNYYRVKCFIESKLKQIYRFIFKKGMD